MNLPEQVDFCVLGAGLAGLGVSKHLLNSGASVCVIDVKDIASGASGTPFGLVNPATGRFGKKVWEAEQCLSGVEADLKEVQQTAETELFVNTGVLRPAQTEKMAKRMFTTATESDWPDGWCTWLDKHEMESNHPNLHFVEGAMWLPKGLTVNIEAYLKAKAALLQTRGLHVQLHAEYKVNCTDSGYEIHFANGKKLNCTSLVFASGFDTHKSPFWEFLTLHPIKGQVAIFQSPEAANFDYSISALGYIASISDTEFMAGSTYEHHFSHLEPDQEGVDYLINRLQKVYPVLFEDAKLTGQWAGVRASTPDKKPVLGEHPEHKNMYVFTGLGSKGLLYSDYVGKLLAEHILQEGALPPAFDIARL